MSKVKLIVTIKSNMDMFPSFPYSMSVAITSERIADDIPIAQGVIDFLSLYQKVLGIVVGDIKVSSDINDAFNTAWSSLKKDKYVIANVFFAPKDETCRLYNVTGVPYIFDFEDKFELEELTDVKFSEILLDCYTNFVSGILKSSVLDEDVKYPYSLVSICDVDGILIENLPEVSRGKMLHELMRLESEYPNVKVINVKCDKNGKPFSLEKRLFKNRFGWFVYFKNKNILKKEKQIILNKKNFKIEKEQEDLFEFLRTIERNIALVSGDE